jgi:hypothetical protein
MPTLTDISLNQSLERLYAANPNDHNAPYRRASNSAALTGIQDDCIYRIDPRLDSINATDLDFFPDIGN